MKIPSFNNQLPNQHDCAQFRHFVSKSNDMDECFFLRSLKITHTQVNV
jgi:hypothetical protein